jgi:hypothetical protein
MNSFRKISNVNILSDLGNKEKYQMKQYTFLLKPVLFIFNLVFATWMVFAIEKIRPSDFGRYGDLFNTDPPSALKFLNKKAVLKLCKDYKAGLIDSTELEKRVNRLFNHTQQTTDKQ